MSVRVKYLNSMTSIDGTTLGDYITDQNGSIELTGLDEGTYVIDELSAPEDPLRGFQSMTHSRQSARL